MDSGSEKYKEKVLYWLKTIVIGLNFCPFAKKPFDSNRVRIVCNETIEEDVILEIVLAELIKLEESKSSELETTLIALPNAYPDFHDFNGLLYVLNNVIEMEGFEGIFQIASFHPAYQFSGTQVDDVENYTNRAPYPILHLIREDSISIALEQHPDPDSIPDKNIKRLQSLSQSQLKDYFSFLSES